MKISTEMKRTAAGLLVLVLGVFLVTIGIRNGETRVVLEKAVNICLECIGIG